MHRTTRVIGTVLAAIIFAPVPTRAETLLIPFFGVNFGGDSGKDVSEAFDTKQYNWGGSITFMGGGVFGVEGDFGFSPDFYGKTDVGGSTVSTATEIDENDLTWSAGGGVLVFFGTRTGIRFDIRYFQTFDDLEILGVPIAESPGKVDFTRGSLGFVLRF